MGVREGERERGRKEGEERIISTMSCVCACTYVSVSICAH